MAFKIIVLCVFAVIAIAIFIKSYKDNKNPMKLLAALLCMGLLILMGISLFKFGELLTFYSVFPWIVDTIARETGMNIWLARSLAVPLAALMIYALRLSLSWNDESKRQLGLIIVAAVIMITSLIMFFVEKDYVFSAAGVPVKCYASTPSGYEEVPCNWNVHRVFGTPVIRDPEKIRAVVTSGWMAKQDKPLTSKKIIPTADIAFFSPGGEPILWYYQHPDGKLDFFAKPGFHPQLRVMLSPVNSEIASLAMRYLQEGKGNMVGANIGTSAQKPSEQAKFESANALEGLEQFRKTLNKIEFNEIK